MRATILSFANTLENSYVRKKVIQVSSLISAEVNDIHQMISTKRVRRNRPNGQAGQRGYI